MEDYFDWYEMSDIERVRFAKNPQDLVGSFGKQSRVTLNKCVHLS